MTYVLIAFFFVLGFVLRPDIQERWQKVRGTWKDPNDPHNWPRLPTDPPIP